MFDSYLFLSSCVNRTKRYAIITANMADLKCIQINIVSSSE